MSLVWPHPVPFLHQLIKPCVTMEPNQTPDKEKEQPIPAEAMNGAPNASEADILQDEAQQAEYRKAYLEQLRRMSCPGCGEDPTLPF
jgi:hypothetical protein